jgi:hypothetical protein
MSRSNSPAPGSALRSAALQADAETNSGTLWQQFAAGASTTDDLVSSMARERVKTGSSSDEFSSAERVINGVVVVLTLLISCLPFMAR